MDLNATVTISTSLVPILVVGFSVGIGISFGTFVFGLLIDGAEWLVDKFIKK